MFLDRDGIVNWRIVGDYVRCAEEFVLLPDFVDFLRGIKALGFLSILVTNQQGIGKGLVSPDAVAALHEQLQQHLQRTLGSGVDDIFVCPDLEGSNSPYRKPEPECCYRRYGNGTCTRHSVGWSAIAPATSLPATAPVCAPCWSVPIPQCRTLSSTSVTCGKRSRSSPSTVHQSSPDLRHKRSDPLRGTPCSRAVASCSPAPLRSLPPCFRGHVEEVRVPPWMAMEMTIFCCGASA